MANSAADLEARKLRDPPANEPRRDPNDMYPELVYRHPDTKPLRDKLKPGRVLALCGGSGAGKLTYLQQVWEGVQVRLLESVVTVDAGWREFSRSLQPPHRTPRRPLCLGDQAR